MLQYSTLGDSSRPALLFLHGFLGSGDSWRFIAESFAASHYCILPDLPGCGASTEREIDQVLDFPLVVDELGALINGEERKQVTIVGYSLGARVAIAFATEHPERVGGLLLESGNPGIADASERKERLEKDRLLAERIRCEGLPAFVDYWYDKVPLFQSLHRDPKRLAELKQRRVATSNPIWAAKVLEELSPALMPNYWPALASISAPTHVVAGELDTKYCALAERTAELIPGATYQIVADAGHNVHFEQPERFIEQLSRLLQ